jgi:hypothetical protein
MRSMYQPPSDSVINSINAVNRVSLSTLKKHLRECIGMEELFAIHCFFVSFDVKLIFIVYPSFPSTIYIYFQRRSTDETS